MKKRVIAWTMSCVLAIGMSAACVSAESVAEAPEKKHIKAAFLPEVMDDNQTAIKTAFQMEIENYNNSDGDYYFDDFLVLNADGNLDTQIGYLENLITQDVDVCVCFPVDPAGIIPGFKAATKDGIGIADWYSADTDAKICNMSFNESVSGGIVRDYMDKYLEENPDAVLNVGIVYPDATSTSLFGRCDEVKSLEEKYPDRFNVLVTGYGNWATDDTQKLVEDWIQAYPDLNYVHNANDEEALGAINALEGAGIKDNVLVTGINGGALGCDLVKKGKEFCSVAQDKQEMAKACISAWIAYLDGTIDEMVDENLNFDVSEFEVYKLLTDENADEWLAHLNETGL